MLDFLTTIFRRQQTSCIEPIRPGGWIIDLPATGGVRLGPFRTQEEAFDARREFIIRTLSEHIPEESPF